MTLPLAGVKILDFSTLLPGPWATMVLADLGAEVLRIESTRRIDLVRLLPPTDGVCSAASDVLHRNKRSLTLNLKTPEALEIIQRLLQTYDVLLEQFRPGVMAALGLDYAALEPLNRRLIYVSLTGYGQTGPWAKRAGHDLNYMALSGLNSYTGTTTEGPRPLGFQLADLGGGSMFSLVGLLAALYQREKTGLGQAIDVAMLDATMAYGVLPAAEWLVGQELPGYETGWLNGGMPAYNNYPTLDGRYLAVGALEPQFFSQFAEGLGLPELLEEQENFAQCRTLIAQRIAEKTLAEWVTIFAGLDACVEPVLNLAEVENHPQIQARGMIAEVPLPQGGRQKQIAHPLRFSASSPQYRHTGPKPGQHNLEVLDELGYSQTEKEALQAKGILK